MIATISGDVKHIDEGFIIVKHTQHPIGYRVHVVNPSAWDPGEFIDLWTVQVFKEEDVRLYGFESLSESTLFERLLKIKGVGPKAALSVIKGGVDYFWSAVNSNDLDYFRSKPRIGPKLAVVIIDGMGSKKGKR